MEVHVEAREHKRSGRFTVLIDGEPCSAVCSSTPFLDAARVLIARGVDPASTLVAVRGGLESFRTSVGHAARLSVREDKHGRQPPRFVAYKPYPGRD